MHRWTALIAGALVALLAAAAAPASERPPSRGPQPGLLGVYDDMLLTPDATLSARAPDERTGVAFWFAPADGRPAVLAGLDRSGIVPTAGPDCDEREPCSAHGEYAAPVLPALRRLDEGYGELTARSLATGAAIGGPARVYWDGTPPRASFVLPRFGATDTGRAGWHIVLHSADENLVTIKVSWMLANAGNRNIPTYEQHLDGAGLGLGGHWSCVPTAFVANLQWLQDTGQWSTVPTSLCGSNRTCFVGIVGLLMGTNVNQSGTTGGGFQQGTIDYLKAGFGYLPGVHYTVDYPAPQAMFGISPEQMVEEFQAGGVINLNITNLPSEGGWGHEVSVDNAYLNQDGTASVRIMDPHTAPTGTQGAYRWLTLYKNGTMSWDGASFGYHNVPSGLVRAWGIQTLRDFVFIAQSSLLRLVSHPRSERPSAPVDGRMVGRHDWVGTFTPPRDTRGPYLLVSRATDASGHTQTDYQLVGGPAASGEGDR